MATSGTGFGYYSYNGPVVHGIAAQTVPTNCTVSGNSATGAGGGLATLGAGTTTATGTTVSGNSASGSVVGQGGGIFGSGDVLNLVRSKVKGIKATTAYPDIFTGP